MLTKLEAVNLITSSVGLSPTTTLNTDDPDIVAATLRLENTTKEFNAKGFWFNTDYTTTLSPDPNGEIIVPATAMEVRTETYDYLALRDGKLYDPRNNTFNIGTSVQVTILYDLDFADIPYIAQNAIQYAAARRFQADFDGDSGRTTDLRADEQMSMIELNKAQIRNSPKNTLYSTGSLRLTTRVQRYTTGRNPVYPGGRP